MGKYHACRRRDHIISDVECPQIILDTENREDLNDCLLCPFGEMIVKASPFYSKNKIRIENAANIARLKLLGIYAGAH